MRGGGCTHEENCNKEVEVIFFLSWECGWNCYKS